MTPLRAPASPHAGIPSLGPVGEGRAPDGDAMIELGGWSCPSGWTIEAPPYLRGCVVINHPAGGSVTVDFEKRIFGLGHAIPHTWRESMTFKGGNWRFRLMTAAAQHLQSVMEGQP